MSSINFIAVIVSAVVAYLANFVWFTMLFRAPYIEGLGKTVEELGKGPSMIHASILQVIGNFVMASVLAWLMVRLGFHGIGQGLFLATIIWIGFIAAVLGPMLAFQAFSFQFFLITSGSILVSLLIAGAVIGSWM